MMEIFDYKSIDNPRRWGHTKSRDEDFFVGENYKINDGLIYNNPYRENGRQNDKNRYKIERVMTFSRNMTKKSPKTIGYLRVSTVGQDLEKSKFELLRFSKQLSIHGLRKRFPDLTEEEFQKLLLEHFDKCHNRNY